MQIIESGGGPYIIVDSQTAPSWLGADGKSFFSEGSGETDYEVLEQFLNSKGNIARIDSIKGSAMLITLPFDVALIDSGEDFALMAQVQNAEADWSFSAVKGSDFDKASFDEHIPFHSEGGKYFVFDSAYLATEMENVSLKLELATGDYVLSSAGFQPDEFTVLSLYRISRVIPVP